MIRVGIADDHELLREGLALILDAQPDIEVVGEARDGADALRLAREHRPDVIIMDVRMPGLDGVEATRRIMADRLDTRVLVLTMYDLDDHVHAALLAGASGFLLKGSPRASVIAAVRAVHAGDVLLAPAVTRRLVQHLTHRVPTRPTPRILDGITAREREVLVLVAQGRTNPEIAVRLGIGEATVKSHVAHLLSKLAQRDRVQLVVVAYESGLVVVGAPPRRC